MRTQQPQRKDRIDLLKLVAAFYYGEFSLINTNNVRLEYGYAFISIVPWDVTTHPCLNFNGCVSILQLNRRWVRMSNHTTSFHVGEITYLYPDPNACLIIPFL